jgi:hypothetical protein
MEGMVLKAEAKSLGHRPENDFLVSSIIHASGRPFLGFFAVSWCPQAHA